LLEVVAQVETVVAEVVLVVIELIFQLLQDYVFQQVQALIQLQ
tara:strand:- start:645 stop:773 length:129 start_codon:yes stop_codon:yes gene_type:complete